MQHDLTRKTAGILLAVATAANQLLWAGVALGAEPSRQNIVLFIADDLSWSDCSIYRDSGIKTPNMERLAAAGKTFTHAFVASPSCAPSRAALLTGLAPPRNGAMFNHTLPEKRHQRWPAYFRELGYETAAIGKVAHYATVQEYGFDYVSHFKYHEDDCIAAAVAWLEKRQSDKPLCLLVGTNWPHVPWPEKTDYPAGDVKLPPTQVDTAETRSWRSRYAAAVSQADRDLGLVFDAARKHLGDDTLFFFTSDHGSQFPFGKWNCYDDGIRTPLVAVWPGKIEAGSRSDAMVSWVDLLPTCYQAAGGQPPQSGTGRGKISGESFLKLLTGDAAQHRSHVFATHSGDGAMNNYPMRSVRSRHWKYIRNLTPNAEYHTHIDKARVADGQGYWSSWQQQASRDPAAAAIVERYHRRPAEELYDLGADPWEQHNLAKDPAHGEKLSELRTELDAWMSAQGDSGLATEEKRRPQPARRVKSTSSRPPPNIIIVLTDDFGWGDLGCQGGQFSTPQLDQMAREGTRFTRYYAASPICSPSRAGLLTGQFPARWRITSFLQTRQGNRDCQQADFLDPGAPSLPRILRAAGYATAHVGKWHLGGGRDVQDAPKFAEYGYDAGLGTYESPEPHPDITASNWIWSPDDKVQRWQRTAWMIDRTLEFIDANPNKPSFVNLWLDDTHTPWIPNTDEISGRRAKSGDSRHNFTSVLAEMDTQIGRLLDELRNRQERRETLVLFLSDNGPLPTFGQTRTGGLRGSKLSLYEGGIRVPCIAWWPGRIPANRVNDRTVLAAVDFLPTLCTLAGGKLPEGYVGDGEDLSTAILGETPLRTKTLFWEYGRNDKSFAYPKSERHRSPVLAVRDGNWKLLVNSNGSGVQLFDLAADPHETEDLSHQQSEVAGRLRAMALAWRRELPQGD